MKNLYSLTALLLLFIITAANLLSPCLSEDGDGIGILIQKICSHSTDYAACDFVLQRNLIWPRIDFAGLTRITTRETLGYATNTLKYIQNAMADDGDPSVRAVYGICEKCYTEVVRYLTRADYYAQKGNFKSMVSQLQLARTMVYKCDDATSAPGQGGDNDLIRLNTPMSVLIKMGLYEGSML